MYHTLIIILLSSLCAVGAYAEGVFIRGTIRDVETGAPLAAANIQIQGTYRGTISNEDGVFALELDLLPATILVRYIGYESAEVAVPVSLNTSLDIRLTPTVLDAEPIVIIGEDPALGIMREVIKRKQEWYPRLKTFSASAYTRLNISNDDGIVSISESSSDLYWDAKDGHREVMTARHETSNIKTLDLFAMASFLPNLYADDIDIEGFEVIGVTHPDALEHYDFRLEGQRHIDDKQVFDISVHPKNDLQPMVVGDIVVLDEEFALLEVNVKLNPAIPYPFPIQEWDASYRQQFSDFGKEFWLPLDVRVEGYVTIGMVGLQIPRIGYRQISRITDYAVNTDLPDSLFRSDRIVKVDSTRANFRPEDVEDMRVIPLSHSENEAYVSIDSTMTLEKAFEPTGFLARMARVGVQNGDENAEDHDRGTRGRGNLLSGFRPEMRFNRVEELGIGALWKGRLFDRVKLNLGTTYSTGQDEWSFNGGLRYDVMEDGSLFMDMEYHEETISRYDSELWGPEVTGLRTVMGFDDYFDFYRSEGFVIGLGGRIRPLRMRTRISYKHESHYSREKTTYYDIFARDVVQRPNPLISEGDLRSVTAELQFGEDPVPMGIVGQRRAKLSVEYSDDEFESDFSFTRYQAVVDWRQPLMLRRRPLPIVLDVRAVGGLTSGTVPIQRFGILDGALGVFGPFGSFKSLRSLPLEGEEYVGLFWELNLRTVPFEIVGLDGVARNNIGLIIHGASGRTWISDDRLSELEYSPRYKDSFHNELGLSLNGIWGFFRLDLTADLDDGTIYGGIGVARMF